MAALRALPSVLKEMTKKIVALCTEVAELRKVQTLQMSGYLNPVRGYWQVAA